MTRRTFFSFGFTIACLLVFSACIGNSSAPGTTYYYTLSYASKARIPAQRLPYVLRVNRFSVSPPFNTQGIVYADKGPHRNTYTYHHWIASPGELLSYFLARDLEYSDGFIAVLPADTSQPATHDVYGWVEEFIELDNHNPWQASVRIHITLASASEPDPSRRILMQKRYRHTTNCTAKTPTALAEAMSISVAKIFETIVIDLHSRLAFDR